jgi:hypothetical protein
LTDVIGIGLIRSTIVGGGNISALGIVNMGKLLEWDKSFPVVLIGISWENKITFALADRNACTIIHPNIPIDIRIIYIQTDRKEAFNRMFELFPVSGPVEPIE